MAASGVSGVYFVPRSLRVLFKPSERRRSQRLCLCVVTGAVVANSRNRRGSPRFTQDCSTMHQFVCKQLLNTPQLAIVRQHCEDKFSMANTIVKISIVTKKCGAREHTWPLWHHVRPPLPRPPCVRGEENYGGYFSSARAGGGAWERG